ncbi:MAG: hypothetical protein VB071_11205 [Lawsonibacter sp.]|nr:hypothetical protein [Lawsonibacter sp.]
MCNPSAQPKLRTGTDRCGKMMRKAVLLATVGGLLYSKIELLWRGRTHWTMALLGGLLFVLIGGLNEWLPWGMPLPIQAGLGALIVTAAELLVGLVVNRWLGWDVWDYSNLWGNVLGQICPVYAALWVFLSAAAIVLDDWLRHWLWGEESPHYTLIETKKMRDKKTHIVPSPNK